MAGQWKKEILSHVATLFEGKCGLKPAAHADEERLYGEIGRLKMELDWLKKIRTMSGETRMGWIDQKATLPLSRQCELAGVARATFYRREAPGEDNRTDLLLCRLIDEEYTRRPFF